MPSREQAKILQWENTCSMWTFPLATERRLNVHKTFRGRPGRFSERLMYVQFKYCVQGVDSMFLSMILT